MSIFLSLSLAGCTQAALNPESQASRWRPKPGTSWQWQLQGKLDTSFEVDAYDLDLFDTSAATIAKLHKRGTKVICYFSAGSYEAWRPDAAKIPKAARGRKMQGWNELWLDVRSTEVKAVMRARLALADKKGCDAVEPDNIDGYMHNSGFALTVGDSLRYSRFLAREAHGRGLSIALKNNLEQAKVLEPYFDFAINEECHAWNECVKLQPFIKARKAVLGVEYDLDPKKFCGRANAANMDFLKKRRSLNAYRFACRS